MALKSGFFNSLNHDRKYNAEDFARLVNAIVTDGVLTTYGEAFMTVAIPTTRLGGGGTTDSEDVSTGYAMSVNVKSGFAWFNSTWSMLESMETYTIAPADATRKRIDAIVLEVDTTEAVRKNSIKVIKGEPSAAPANPTLLNTDTVHQHPLAYISIPAGAVGISPANINIRVGQPDCPFASGKLESISITDLFNAWDEEFTIWFDNLKIQLGDDVVTNLQNQIDTVKTDVSNVSTFCTEFIYVTKTWTIPKGIVDNIVHVILVGGGGGGGAGMGGSSSGSANNGNTGGTSSFGSYVSASGGSGGQGAYADSSMMLHPGGGGNNYTYAGSGSANGGSGSAGGISISGGGMGGKGGNGAGSLGGGGGGGGGGFSGTGGGGGNGGYGSSGSVGGSGSFGGAGGGGGGGYAGGGGGGGGQIVVKDITVPEPSTTRLGGDSAPTTPSGSIKITIGQGGVGGSGGSGSSNTKAYGASGGTGASGLCIISYYKRIAQ